MSSLAEEDDSGIALVVRAHKALEKLNPAHELLKLVTIEHDRGFFATEEFNKRYLQKPDSGSYEQVMLARLATTGKYESDLVKSIKAELVTRLKAPGAGSNQLEDAGVLEIVRTYLR